MKLSKFIIQVRGTLLSKSAILQFSVLGHCKEDWISLDLILPCSLTYLRKSKYLAHCSPNHCSETHIQSIISLDSRLPFNSLLCPFHSVVPLLPTSFLLVQLHCSHLCTRAGMWWVSAGTDVWESGRIISRTGHGGGPYQSLNPPAGPRLGSSSESPWWDWKCRLSFYLISSYQAWLMLPGRREKLFCWLGDEPWRSGHYIYHTDRRWYASTLVNIIFFLHCWVSCSQPPGATLFVLIRRCPAVTLLEHMRKPVGCNHLWAWFPEVPLRYRIPNPAYTIERCNDIAYRFFPLEVLYRPWNLNLR